MRDYFGAFEEETKKLIETGLPGATVKFSREMEAVDLVVKWNGIQEKRRISLLLLSTAHCLGDVIDSVSEILCKQMQKKLEEKKNGKKAKGK